MSTTPAGLPQGGNLPSQQCLDKWAELSVQLSPFNSVVTIDERDFQSWSRVDQQFVLNNYALATGGAQPRFIRDGSMPRVFLGPPAVFRNQALVTPPAQVFTMGQIAQQVQQSLQAQVNALPAPVTQATTIASGIGAPSSRASSPQSDGEKIPRPANAWIMYRKHHHASFVAANPGVHNNQISGLISTKWHAEPQVVRDYWHMLADQAKVDHKLKYPGYVYKPRKSSEKKRRMTKKKAAALESAQLGTQATVGNELPEQQYEANATAVQNQVDHLEEAKIFAQALTQGIPDAALFLPEIDGFPYQTEDGEDFDENFLDNFFSFN